MAAAIVSSMVTEIYAASPDKDDNCGNWAGMGECENVSSAL